MAYRVVGPLLAMDVCSLVRPSNRAKYRYGYPGTHAQHSQTRPLPSSASALCENQSILERFLLKYKL